MEIEKEDLSNEVMEEEERIKDQELQEESLASHGNSFEGDIEIIGEFPLRE